MVDDLASCMLAIADGVCIVIVDPVVFVWVLSMSSWTEL